ncbi:MAG: RimK-like ATPgrasp N-terminal domain-containing protein, partial [Proteobacteria bacterium]|nr:RimK-like ATPgrasp N-terminal domain-containing protein [Pseudomonadota bacterium]
MQSIIVTNNPKDWIFQLSNVEVVSANQYIDDPSYANQRNYRVYNLCRSYRYKSLGYYVSLLAEARGHRIFPSVSTIQDQKSQSIIRVLSDDIDHLIQKSLSKLKSKEFHLSIYFGKNVATQYDKLSKQLYNLFQAPLLSAQFVYHKKWILQNITLLQINEIP